MTENRNLAKFNMIVQQMRPWEVLDERVLNAIESLDRTDFVDKKYQGLAYADCQVPICHDVALFPPTIEGRMLQALLIDESDDILEVGTGSGYITCCLARLGRSVLTLDCNPQAIDIATANIAQQNMNNIQIECANCHEYRFDQHFDVIAVTASMPSVPQNLKQQLKIGGRLFVICGQSPAMQAVLITRVNEHEWLSDSLFETNLPGLLN